MLNTKTSATSAASDKRIHDRNEIRETIALDIAGTAWWRSEKAKGYPDDRRNAEAAASLERLESDVTNINDELAIRYQTAWDDAFEIQEDATDVSLERSSVEHRLTF